AFAGFALIVYLSTHGFDRAVLLIPTWFLLVVWVIAAGMTLGGSVTNDIVGPALLGGLVLIVMLIGFTVMQHAFAGAGATAGKSVLHHRKSDQHHDQHKAAEQRRADDVVGDAASQRHAGCDH